MHDTITVESTPLDRNAPTSTSLTSLSRTASSSRASTAATASAGGDVGSTSHQREIRVVPSTRHTSSCAGRSCATPRNSVRGAGV